MLSNNNNNLAQRDADQIVYTNLRGQALSFKPNDKIKELNISNPTTQPNLKRFDYQAYQPSTHIGYAESWGRRVKQEDRVVCAKIDDVDFSQFARGETEKIFNKTIHGLQTSIVNLQLGKFGSTFCGVVLNRDYIVTANVGDSAAFLFIMNEEGSVIQAEQLNSLHRPSDEKECARLRAGNFKITDDNRLELLFENGKRHLLSVSRSLGDQLYEGAGIIHTPDIYIHRPNIPVRGKAIVMVACDGLTEKGMKLTEMITLIEKHHHLPTNRIAAELVKLAAEGGVVDNTSVLVAELDTKEKQNNSRMMVVLDGHGGDQVSQALSYWTKPMLSIQARIACLNKIRQSKEFNITTLSQANIVISVMSQVEIYLPRLFEGFTHNRKNSSEQDWMRLKSILDLYDASLARILQILNADLVDEIKLKREVKLLNSFSDIIFSLKTLDHLRLQYCKTADEKFFIYPKNIILMISDSLYEAGRSLEKLELENVEKISFNLMSKLPHLEALYKAMGALLSIRTQFDPDLPSSFDSVAFNTYQNELEQQSSSYALQKNLIMNIERKVDLCMRQDATESIDSILKSLISEFERLKDEYSPFYVSMLPFNMFSFLKQDELKLILDKTSSILSELVPSHHFEPEWK